MTYKDERDKIYLEMDHRLNIHKMMNDLFQGAVLTQKENSLLKNELSELTLLRKRLLQSEREREKLQSRVNRVDTALTKWQRYAMTFAEVIFDYEEDGFKVPAKIKKMMKEASPQ